jgi:hypothetical protein
MSLSRVAFAARSRTEKDHSLRFEVLDHRIEQVAWDAVTRTSAVRPSRRPLRSLLRIRIFLQCHEQHTSS